MSYILDALRKSDQLRQRGAAPTLLTAHVAAAAPKQPPYLLYGVVAVALIGAGIAIGQLPLWQAQQPVAAPATTPITLDTVRSDEPAPPFRKAAPPLQSAAAPAPAPVVAEMPATPAAITQAPAVAPAPAQPAVIPVQEQKVTNISELPMAIQQAIPRMSISVHAYSPKLQERVVMINNQMMHEGQELAPGLRLEQITPDGMIFSFSGYRFRRGLQQSGESAEMK